MRTLLKIALLISSISNADVYWPDISGPLSAYSCQLRMAINGPAGGPKDEPVCSGTFFRENLFLLAAHCMARRFSVGDLRNDISQRYYISCPGSKIVNVQFSFINPEYYKIQGYLNSEGEISDHTPPSLAVTNEGDIAVLVTEPIAINAALPRLVLDRSSFSQIENLNRCQVLGYSPTICDIGHPQKCMRHAEMAFANFSDFLGLKNVEDFAPGDSGAGIICQDEQNRPHILGLYANYRHQMRLDRFHDFLTPFLSEMDVGQRIQPLHYSNQAIDGSEVIEKIQKFVTGYALVKCHESSSECLRASSIFLAALKSYPDTVARLNGSEIHDIEFVKAPSEDRNSLVPDALNQQRIYNDHTLYVRIDAEQKDVDDFFSNLPPVKPKSPSGMLDAIISYFGNR